MNIIFLEQNTKNVSEGSLASVCSSKTVDILKLCTVVLIRHVQGHHAGLPHHGMDVTGQVPGQLSQHTAPGHRLKQLGYLRTSPKLVRPELDSWLLDQLYECDQKPPGVRPVHNQSLKQHPAK